MGMVPLPSHGLSRALPVLGLQVPTVAAGPGHPKVQILPGPGRLLPCPWCPSQGAAGRQWSLPPGCFLVPGMFPFPCDVSFSLWCFLVPGMFPCPCDVSFSPWCFLVPVMFPCPWDVSLSLGCFLVPGRVSAGGGRKQREGLEQSLAHSLPLFFHGSGFPFWDWQGALASWKEPCSSLFNAFPVQLSLYRSVWPKDRRKRRIKGSSPTQGLFTVSSVRLISVTQKGFAQASPLANCRDTPHLVALKTDAQFSLILTEDIFLNMTAKVNPDLGSCNSSAMTWMQTFESTKCRNFGNFFAFKFSFFHLNIMQIICKYTKSSIPICKYCNDLSWELLPLAVLAAIGRLCFNNQSNSAPLVPCTQYLYNCFSEAFCSIPHSSVSFSRLLQVNSKLKSSGLNTEFCQWVVKWCGINILSEGVFQSELGFFSQEDYFDVLRLCWFWECVVRSQSLFLSYFYSYWTCWDSSYNYNINTLPASKCKVF